VKLIEIEQNIAQSVIDITYTKQLMRRSIVRRDGALQETYHIGKRMLQATLPLKGVKGKDRTE